MSGHVRREGGELSSKCQVDEGGGQYSGGFRVYGGFEKYTSIVI